MWIPKSEGEILAAIEAGDLIETANFDAKAALPAKGKSKDLAIDVAAMSTDGGTLLYGIGEDDNDRPTMLQPFRLAGARERVDQILRTSVAEPPEVQVREIPTDGDPFTSLPALWSRMKISMTERARISSRFSL